MRRFAFLLVAIGLVGWSVTTVVGGCGADEATADNPDATPESGPFSPGTSGSTGTPGSNGTSGLPSSSGTSGTDTPVPEGGAPQGPPSNPGKLTCGATECDAGDFALCCIRDGGSDTECRRFSCGGQGALAITCDETADCPKGGQQQRQRICCYDQNTTLCAPDCNDNPQVCKTDAECGDAGPCNPKSCGNRGNLLYVCGSPTGCK